MQLGLQGKSTLLSGRCCMAHTAIFTVPGPYSVMQSGASPGSYVGNMNDWILFLWSIVVIFCLGFQKVAWWPRREDPPSHAEATQKTDFAV